METFVDWRNWFCSTMFEEGRKRKIGDESMTRYTATYLSY